MPHPELRKFVHEFRTRNGDLTTALILAHIMGELVLTDDDKLLLLSIILSSDAQHTAYMFNLYMERQHWAVEHVNYMLHLVNETTRHPQFNPDPWAAAHVMADWGVAIQSAPISPPPANHPPRPVNDISMTEDEDWGSQRQPKPDSDSGSKTGHDQTDKTTRQAAEVDEPLLLEDD